MPAWQRGKALGVKPTTPFPEKGAKNLPAVSSLYMLFDGPGATIDAEALTSRRAARPGGINAHRLLGSGKFPRHQEVKMGGRHPPA